MVTAKPHIIRKQRVIAHCRGEQADAFELQRQLTDLLSGTQANQVMDTVLSEFSADDNWIVLDKIEITVGTLTGDGWEADFLQQVQTALRNKLFDAIPDAVLQGKVVQKTSEQVDFEQLIYFLRHGFFEHLPFELTRSEKTAAFQAWVADLIGKLSDNQLHVLTALLVQQATARQRFLHQVAPESWLLFLQKLVRQTSIRQVSLEQAHAYMAASDPVRRQSIFERILNYIYNKQSVDLEDIKRVSNSAVSLKDTGDFNVAEPIPDHLFVQNAGVVLLHPFVFICFDALGWLENGRFIHETARQKAVLMWHYLATGNNRADEYELTLAKLLSGLPLQTPFLGELILLTEAEKEEAEALLRAAISHWSALKNTSPDGLRAEFLQREGKIEPGPFGGYTLTVEQRPSDVLLNSLPWGMSLVKLGWMNEIIYVNWA